MENNESISKNRVSEIQKMWSNPVSGVLDSIKVNAQYTSGFLAAKINPLEGISSVINTGLLVQKYLTPFQLTAKELNNPISNASSVISSLATLKNSIDSISINSNVFDSYKATLNSLSSVASLASSIQEMTKASSSIFVNKYGDSSQSFLHEYSKNTATISSYISASASVFSVEKSLNMINTSPKYDSHLFKNHLSRAYLHDLKIFQSGIVELSNATKLVCGQNKLFTSYLDSNVFSILRQPAVEVYTNAHAIASVTLNSEYHPDVDDEIEATLDESSNQFVYKLSKLDKELVETYNGAIYAIESEDPDWQRHSMVSFRELCTHVLHKLTPDSEVLPLLAPNDLHDGKPTRIARLNHIFANIGNGELTKFYQADMKSAIELFNLLNSGTHKLGAKATKDQFRYLRSRVVGLVDAMLTAKNY